MRRIFLLLAVGILLAAACLRLYRLETYPPGPHYDEAANVLIARSVAFGGADLFPIANSYQGRETLYHYLSVPFFWYVADDIFVLQLVSAFANLLTIAASMQLGRVMFRGNRGGVIGLTIGLLMAISFHQVWLSRQAYRAVSLPLMQALGLLFLWRGLVSRRYLWLILGGIFCAGALYTYMASRLFPFWLLLGGLALIWFDRTSFRSRLVQGGVFFTALGIAALPMVNYALNNPDIFFNRLDEVAGGEVTVSLAESIQRHAEMFFIRGDFGNLRYNVPGRPYFTPVEGLLLVIGWFVALWRFLCPGRVTTYCAPTERSGYFLALLSPLMVIPSVISVGGYPPSHMRSLGMVPLIFVLVAVGFEAVLSFIGALVPLDGCRGMARHAPISFATARAGLRPAPTTPILVTAVLGVLLIGSVSVWRIYFNWAQRADLFFQADGDLEAVVRWLPTHTDDETRVYIGSYHREHPTVLIGSEQPVIWLGTDSLFLPPEELEGVAIFAHDTPPSPEWLSVLQPFRFEDVPPGPDGNPAFWAYHVTSELMPETISRTPLAQNAFLTLLNVTSGAIHSGGIGDVTLVWRVEQRVPYQRLRPIVTLRNDAGVPLSTKDVFLQGTDRWLPGEVVFQRIPLDVPLGTPPGNYQLEVAWVDRDTDLYVSYVTQDGKHAGISALAGLVRVVHPDQFPSPDLLPIQVRQPIDAAPGVRLLGWNPPSEPVRPGETMTTTLFWQAVTTHTERTALEYQVVLGNSETDIWLGELAYSSDQWVDGELVTDYARWTIPDEQPQGETELYVQFDEQKVLLSTLQVTGLPRIYEPVEVDTVVKVEFEDSLGLYGYSLKTDGAVMLDLLWTARGEPSSDYTVFVHLLDENGVVVDQIDQMPQQNTYPTSLWVEGEYVSDHYEFINVPPGIYRLRLGLYNQSNGGRLAIVDQEKVDYIELYEVMVKT